MNSAPWHIIFSIRTNLFVFKMNPAKYILPILCVANIPFMLQAATTAAPLYKPFYIGINGGVGATTWKALVPQQGKNNIALSISTPIGVHEGGTVFGFYLGYELSPYFALESSFRQYPNAKIQFHQFSLYAFDHDDRVILDSYTYTINVMAKVMLKLPETPIKLYSSFGAGGVHRFDELTEQWHLSPTFGLGFNINVSPRFMIDIGINYTAGYGVSELSPANSYIPFLYSGTFGLAYRI